MRSLLPSFREAVSKVAAVSLAIGYPTQASVPHSIANAFKAVLAVTIGMENYSFEKADMYKEYLADPSKFAGSGGGGGGGGGGAAEAAAPEVEEEEEVISLFGKNQLIKLKLSPAGSGTWRNEIPATCASIFFKCRMILLLNGKEIINPFYLRQTNSSM